MCKIINYYSPLWWLNEDDDKDDDNKEDDYDDDDEDDDDNDNDDNDDDNEDVDENKNDKDDNEGDDNENEDDKDDIIRPYNINIVDCRPIHTITDKFLLPVGFYYGIHLRLC